MATGLADSESSPGEFPWTCALIQRDQFSGAEEFLGNCAIIPSGFDNNNDDDNEVKVITAAHVLDLMKFDELVVRVGEWDTNRFKPPSNVLHQDYTVVRFRAHPNASDPDPSTNDLAVLNTQPPIQLNSRVNTACLPSSRDQFGRGAQCWLSGWGREGREGRQKKVELPIVDDTTCGDGDGTICAGGDGCAVVGGAPMVCLSEEDGRWTVVGVTSRSAGCAAATPRVLARIADFRQWI